MFAGFEFFRRGSYEQARLCIKPHMLRVLAPAKPESVTMDLKELAENAEWRYDEKQQALYIKSRTYSACQYSIRLP